MLISESKKFVYFSAPKSASTTMRSRLDQYKTESFLERYFDLDENDDHMHLLVGGGMQYITLLDAIICPTHLTVEQFERFPEAVNYQDCSKITFVRNPYDRFYSSYQESKMRHMRRFHPEDALRKKIERVDFRTFVMEELDINRIRFDHRFCNFIPQHYYGYRGVRRAVSFCGHNETFDADYRRLCDLLELEFVEVNAHVRQEQKQCSDINDTDGYKYLSMYSVETVGLVNALYARDFDFFGYRPLDPLDFPDVV